MTTRANDRFILNERWVFDETADRLSDLSGVKATLLLKPIVARLLARMVRAPGEVLPRRRLFDEVWRRYGFEVCDNSLNQAICSLRTLLGELGAGAPTIRTLPRIGYALLADVTSWSLPSASLMCPPPEPTGQSRVDTPALLCDPDAFSSALERAWQRASQHFPITLLMIDLKGAVPSDTANLLTARLCQRLRRTGDCMTQRTTNVFAILLPATDEYGGAAVRRGVEETLQGWMPRDGMRLATIHSTVSAAPGEREFRSAQDWIASLSGLVQTHRGTNCLSRDSALEPMDQIAA